MLFFYIDESGNRDPRMKITRTDGSVIDGDWLYVLSEMPMFVRSELSNGVQLADLCSYNIYRSFKDGNLAYPYFARIVPHIWSRSNEAPRPFSGLHVFPAHSLLHALVEQFEKERARPPQGSGSQVVSGGANPIQPTSGTGQKSKGKN